MVLGGKTVSGAPLSSPGTSPCPSLAQWEDSPGIVCSLLPSSHGQSASRSVGKHRPAPALQIAREKQSVTVGKAIARKKKFAS